MDTIFAMASARGRSGVAVIRVSGPDAFQAARMMCPGPELKLRQASLRNLVSDGHILDQALVILFGKGASFTGEEIVEFQVHGSVSVVAAILNALGQMTGLRAAEPGEFTKRALMNGVLDLTQVEGLADLLAAETESQRRLAQAVFGGAISKKVDGWRKSALRAAALVEASIDFSDEDVPVNVWPEVAGLVVGLQDSLKSELLAGKAAERIRDGFEVAIVGSPNVGKSTLMNALAGRDVAITSAFAGTTRDVIEVRMEIAGLSVTFLDTAGIRETSDLVEVEGIKRTSDRAGSADLRVFLLAHVSEEPVLPGKDDDIYVVGKADLIDRSESGVSGLSGQGVDVLLERIGETLATRVEGAGLFNRVRQQTVIGNVLESLTLVSDSLSVGHENPELVAFELRRATASLGSLVGAIGVEDLLGEIFSSFCIGK